MTYLRYIHWEELVSGICQLKYSNQTKVFKGYVCFWEANTALFDVNMGVRDEECHAI